MSVKQAPAENASGLLGWFSSWLPNAEQEPVQATKKPMPNPSKGMSRTGYYLAGILCPFAS